MTNKIYTFYTGGGITLAEVNLNKGRYAVVSTEAPDCMAIYNRVEGEEPYAPEDMTDCFVEENMSEEMKELHDKLLRALY